MTILNELLIGFRTFYFYLFVWYGWVFGFRFSTSKGKRGGTSQTGGFGLCLVVFEFVLVGVIPSIN